MTAAKKNLDAEIERVRNEYEQMLATVATAEHEHVVERRRLAGQEALGELSPEDALLKRQTLDANLAAQRDRLTVLRDAVPEVERRAAEEAEAQRKLRGKQSGDKLAKACQGRYSASKNLARDLRAVANSGAELMRHRTLVDEAVALHRERLGDELLEWPKAADEEWAASEEVVALLVGGPLQPIADAQREAEEQARVRALQDDEQLVWFEKEATAARKRQLPEHLLHDPRVAVAEADYATKVAEQREQRKKRERERAGEGVRV